MSVKITITDPTLQVTKRNSNGTISENLTWETPDGLPANGSKGSILVNTGTDWVQLPVGTDGYVLTATYSAESGLSWAAGGGGGGDAIQNRIVVNNDVADVGAAVNAANATLGATPGTIWVTDGGGVIGTQIVLSPNRILHFGSGTWTNSLSVPVIKYDSNCTIEGSGWGTVLQESLVWATIVSKANSADNYADGESNVIVKDLQIVGNAAGFDSVAGCIQTGNCHKFLIENVYLNGTKSIGINVGAGSGNAYFAEDVWLRGCQFYQVASQAVGVVNAKRFHVLYNTFKSGGQLGGPGASYLDCEANGATDWLVDFEIIGNLFDGHGAANAGNAILVQHATPTKCGPGVISGNSIWGADYGATSGISNAFFLQNCDSVNVVGNTVRRIGQSAFQAYGLTHSDISNNLFIAVGGGGIDAAYLYDSLHNQIHGNSFLYPSGAGSASIILTESTGSDYNTFYDNFFSNGQDIDGTPNGGVVLSGAHSTSPHNISNGRPYDNVGSFRGAGTVSSSRALTLRDMLLYVDTTSAAVTLTLPLAAYAQEFVIRRVAGTNPVIIAPSGGETIDGSTASLYVYDNYAVPLNTNGTAWYTRRDSGVQATRISVALTQPFASTSLASATVYSAIYWIPPDVTTVYVQVGMRDQYNIAGNAADVTSMKISGGRPSVDRQSFVGSPTNFTGITYPAYNLSSRVAIPVDRDANGYMMFRWTVPSGTNYIEYVTNAGQSGYVWSQTGSDPTIGSGWTTTEAPAGQVVLTYDTRAPKLVIWSDSIQRGVAGTNECGLLNSMVRLGPLRGYSVSSTGVASTKMSVWAAMSNWMLGVVSPVKDATVWIALGTNDIAASETSTNLILYCKQLCQLARAGGAKRLIVSTIPTFTGITGPQDTNRTQYNAWSRSLPSIFDDLLDVDTIIGSTPAYFATGGVHLTTAGMDAIYASFPTLT